MIYEPGSEPEEIKKHLNLLLRDLHEAFPDGLIVGDMWKHEKWDSLLSFLTTKLGYPDSTSLLNAYGFEMFGNIAIKKSDSEPIRTPKKVLSCPTCGSYEVTYETFQENLGTTTVSKQTSKLKQKGHGIFWWLLIGWWWWIIDLFFWIALFPIRFTIQLFKKKKYKGKATTVSQSINEVVYKRVFTCQTCGYSWSKVVDQGSTLSAISKSKDNVKNLKKNIRA